MILAMCHQHSRLYHDSIVGDTIQRLPVELGAPGGLWSPQPGAGGRDAGLM